MSLASTPLGESSESSGSDLCHLQDALRNLALIARSSVPSISESLRQHHTLGRSFHFQVGIQHSDVHFLYSFPSLD